MASILRGYYKKVKRKGDPDPMRMFLDRYSKHHMIKSLHAALESKNAHNIDRVTNRIARDGWRTFVVAVSRSNLKTFYAFLARAEGGGRWGCIPSESTPLIVGDIIALINQEKCDRIAQAFFRKLQARSLLVERHIQVDINECQPKPYGGDIEMQHRRVYQVAIRKAMESPSIYKAPGPDGYAVDVYRKLPCLTAFLKDLLNLVSKTGVIPKRLRKVYLVPIVKQGEDTHLTVSRRPIAPLCAVSKLIASVIRNRILPTIEP